MELMRNCWRDLRYAARNLLRSRGFAAVAALTLTIGIGANTAIFSIIDTILLRPLPFHDPAQLVRLYETEAAPGHYPFAGPDFLDWRAQNRTFQDMALFGWSGDMNLSGEGRPDHVQAVPTQANFFTLIRVQPMLGRTWLPGEDHTGNDQVAILSLRLVAGALRRRSGGGGAHHRIELQEIHHRGRHARQLPLPFSNANVDSAGHGFPELDGPTRQPLG
jgi:putative ABC transport system permease protein